MAENILLKKYSEHKLKSITYLNKGLELLKLLVNHSFDSYIIGEAVADLYLCREIDSITIATSASFNDLKNIFPSCILGETYAVYKEAEGDFIFVFLNDNNLPALLKDYANAHFNKKLIRALQSQNFTILGMALTPNATIIDIFNSIDDIDNLVISSIDKNKSSFEYYPESYYEAFLLVARFNFTLDKKTIKLMNKSRSCLAKVDMAKSTVLLRNILKEKHAMEAFRLMESTKLFVDLPDIDNFIKKLNTRFTELDQIERMSLLYLIVGSIPDKYTIDKLELKEITETIDITKLITHRDVTPMMVYNIGVKKLLSCDKIGITYKKEYKSQAKKIQKLAKEETITSPRELNISDIEIIQLLGGERSIRVRIIMNLILAKVINKEIENNFSVLKEEAVKIDNEMRNIFDYQGDDSNREYTEDEIDQLLKKYHQELSFLVKVYLNDEKELYSLSPAERDLVEAEALEHAHDFLLETTQYQILEERRLI